MYVSKVHTSERMPGSAATIDERAFMARVLTWTAGSFDTMINYKRQEIQNFNKMLILTFWRYILKFFVSALEEARCLATTAAKRSSKMPSIWANEDCFLELRKERRVSFFCSDCWRAKLDDDISPLTSSFNASRFKEEFSFKIRSSSKWLSYSHWPI